MNNQPRRKYTSHPFAILLVLLMTTVGGCQDREVALSIVSVQPYDLETCEVIQTDGVFQVGGVVDLTMRNTYQANLLLENNLVDVPNAKGLKPSDARLSLNAGVELCCDRILNTRPAVDRYSVSTCRPIERTITEESNLTLANFELFSQDVLQQIRNADEFFSVNNGEVIPSRTAVTILARIRIKGRTLDGRDAESNEFLYPVEVCNGCGLLIRQK